MACAVQGFSHHNDLGMWCIWTEQSMLVDRCVWGGAALPLHLFHSCSSFPRLTKHSSRIIAALSKAGYFCLRSLQMNLNKNLVQVYWGKWEIARNTDGEKPHTLPFFCSSAVAIPSCVSIIFCCSLGCRNSNDLALTTQFFFKFFFWHSFHFAALCLKALNFSEIHWKFPRCSILLWASVVPLVTMFRFLFQLHLWVTELHFFFLFFPFRKLFQIPLCKSALAIIITGILTINGAVSVSLLGNLYSLDYILIMIWK